MAQADMAQADTAQVKAAPALADVRDVQFWRDLSPGLSITPDAGVDSGPRPSLDGNQEQLLLQLLRKEGYAQADGFLKPDVAQHLAAAVSRIRAHQLLPVFALVYDEFWWLAHQLRAVMSAVLGDDYRQLPDFWIWYVDPANEDQGWAPHRDKRDPACIAADGTPKSLTSWIALTDVNPLNGCMYLIPAHLDPGYPEAVMELTNDAARNVRALPAAAGTLFLWNQRVMHWGGSSSTRAAGPRISIAFEFQRGDVPPFNSPLIQPDLFPAFSVRLQLIGKQISQYTHMYGYSEALSQLAARLAAGE